MNGDHKLLLNELKWIKKELQAQTESLSKVHTRLGEGEKTFATLSTNQRWHKRFIMGIYGALGGLLILILKLTRKI